MIAATSSLDPRIENYLAKVRATLRGVPDGEVEDILRELRSHVDELAGGEGVEAALASLGAPGELANSYRAEKQLKRAECSNSPLVILAALRKATRTWAGRTGIMALYIFGYVNVIMFSIATADKVIWPARTGLWYTPGRPWATDVVLDGEHAAGARELLGWWLVPCALVAALAFKFVTDRIARWWIARYRRSHGLKEA